MLRHIPKQINSITAIFVNTLYMYIEYNHVYMKYVRVLYLKFYK